MENQDYFITFLCIISAFLIGGGLLSMFVSWMFKSPFYENKIKELEDKLKSAVSNKDNCLTYCSTENALLILKENERLRDLIVNHGTDKKFERVLDIEAICEEKEMYKQKYKDLSSAISFSIKTKIKK